MLVSLGRNGRVVQSGEGSYNEPMGVDEVDNTLSKPVSKAEELAGRNRAEYATMAAISHAQDARNQASADYQAYLASLASEYEEFVSAESAEENGGENPLLYAAAMQSMAGGASEQYTPLGGYLLSQDGQLAYDRAMNGVIRPGMGQVQSLIASAQADYSQAQSAVAPLLALAQGDNQSVAVPASAAPASAVPAWLAPYMAQKVAGIPIPYLAAGALALLLLRRK